MDQDPVWVNQRPGELSEAHGELSRGLNGQRMYTLFGRCYFLLDLFPRPRTPPTQETLLRRLKEHGVKLKPGM